MPDLTSISDQSSAFGPFADLVGMVGAIITAGGAVYAIWGGKLEKWRPPEEEMPGAAQALSLLLCSIGMVCQWYLTNPETINMSFLLVVAMSLACCYFFLRYSYLLGLHIYVKKETTGPNSTKNIRIIGGNTLLPEAKKKLDAEGGGVQAFFERNQYNPDLLWSRDDRQKVKQRLLVFFVLTVVLGTWSLSGVSFATQVLLNSHKIESRPTDPQDTTSPATEPVRTMSNASQRTRTAKNEIRIISEWGEDDGVEKQASYTPSGQWRIIEHKCFIKRTLGQEDPVFNCERKDNTIYYSISGKHGPWYDKWRLDATLVIETTEQN